MDLLADLGGITSPGYRPVTWFLLLLFYNFFFFRGSFCKHFFAQKWPDESAFYLFFLCTVEKKIQDKLWEHKPLKAVTSREHIQTHIKKVLLKTRMKQWHHLVCLYRVDDVIRDDFSEDLTSNYLNAIAMIMSFIIVTQTCINVTVFPDDDRLRVHKPMMKD